VAATGGGGGGGWFGGGGGGGVIDVVLPPDGFNTYQFGSGGGGGSGYGPPGVQFGSTSDVPGVTISYDASVRTCPRPDARIRVGTFGVLRGNDAYNTLTGQTVTASAAARVGRRVVYNIQVQNDSIEPDRFTLEGSPSTTRYRLVYQNPQGVDVTRKVVAGTLRTPVLAPGAIYKVRVTVTVARSAPRTSSLARTLKATSVADRTRTDTVRFTTRRR
jgi:hypothetical protein